MESNQLLNDPKVIPVPQGGSLTVLAEWSAEHGNRVVIGQLDPKFTSRRKPLYRILKWRAKYERWGWIDLNFDECEVLREALRRIGAPT